MSAISVIIPTYNGSTKIDKLMRSLENQTFCPVEVIVVNDGSTDDTTDQLDKFQTALFSLKVINQENQGRAKTRNNGAREAKGELLVFLDDDMRATPELLEMHDTFHQFHDEAFVTGGLMEDEKLMTRDVQFYRMSLSQKWSEELMENNGKLAGDQVFITAANFSVKKKDFDAVQGFDESLRDAEDLELAIRAAENGYQLYYYPQAFAWHDDYISCRSYIKRLREYRESHKKLIQIHPKLASHLYIPEVTNSSKRFIYWLLGRQQLVDVIDGINFFRILPKVLRYKLYEIITYSLSVHYPNRPI